jgi:hypothetical protein
MVREKEITNKIESQLLKHLPSIIETNISIKNTSEELRGSMVSEDAP